MTTNIKIVDGACDLSVFTEFNTHVDDRGSLTELFRTNQLPYYLANGILQGYYSVTKPHVVRGPHEHEYQYDNFIFIGKFFVWLWQPTERDCYKREKRLMEHCSGPTGLLTIPVGTVHAYQNIDTSDGIVMNFASRYYRGLKGTGLVDEIRHEKEPDSPFKIW